MEADSVLQLASCDLKSVGYLSSQLPLLGELNWDKDKQYTDYHEYEINNQRQKEIKCCRRV